MSITSAARFENEALRVGSFLPHGPRVVVIGSTSFWHEESECTCVRVGQLLAQDSRLVLITGGVEGVGEAVGRAFFQARYAVDQSPLVYHFLPEGEGAWDYGETLFAGSDMPERREILARLSEVFLAVEGGPGTVHEAQIAIARGAAVIPVGRSGGHSARLFAEMNCPTVLDDRTWAVLGCPTSTPEETAEAAVRAVRLCLRE